MKLFLLLLLPLMLQFACTDKPVTKPVPRATDLLDSSVIMRPPLALNGGYRDRNTSNSTIATTLERLESLAACQGPGTRITVWSETQQIDGLLHKEEEATVHVGALCDSEQAPRVSLSADSLADQAQLSLAAISETINDSDSNCSGRGGFRVKIWRDADLDKTIDTHEIPTLSTHILCHQEGEHQGSENKKATQRSSGFDASAVMIQKVQLEAKGQATLHQGRQTLICSAEVFTSQPLSHLESLLTAKLYVDGRLLEQKFGASLSEDRYLVNFDLPAGWASTGSEISCEMALRNSLTDPTFFAKAASELRIVSIATIWDRASPRDIIETRSENHGGRLAFVFTLADNAPVLPNSCDLHFIRTLSGTEDIINFELKPGTNRVVTSEAVPRAFDIRLDRFQLSCDGDSAPVMVGRLRWSEGISEINPASIHSPMTEAYQLSETLLEVPFSFQKINSLYLPQTIMNRLNRDTISRISTLRPDQRAAFVEYLARTGQTEVFAQLSNLWIWYAEALRLLPCQSPLMDLRLMSRLFGPRTREMLRNGSKGDCRPYELMVQAASWAEKTQPITSKVLSDFEFFTYLADLKIRDVASFVSLAQLALTQDQSWTRFERAADVMRVVRQQPELLSVSDSSLWKDLLPLIARSNAIKPEDLALWPALRAHLETLLNQPPAPRDISELYGLWLRDYASVQEIESALFQLGEAPDLILQLPRFLAGKPSQMCPILAAALRNRVLQLSEAAHLVSETIDLCSAELLPTLEEGLGAQLLSLFSMPAYVKVLLHRKGEHAPELKSISSTSSPAEIFELLHQGRLGPAQALSELVQLRQVPDFQHLRNRQAYTPAWQALSREAAQSLDQILAPTADRYDATLFTLYLHLLQGQDAVPRMPSILKFGLRGAPALVVASWWQENQYAWTDESRTVLMQSLDDEGLDLTAKVAFIPLYRAAGLDLEGLTLAIMTAFQASATIDLLRGLGPHAAWQNLVVDAYAKGQIEVHQIMKYFREEGCARDTADELQERSRKHSRLIELHVQCLLQQSELNSDEQALVGHHLPTLLSTLEFSADKRHVYLVPALTDAFRANPSRAALYVLGRLTPFSLEAKDALISLQAEFRLSGETKRAMEFLLSREPTE